MLAGCSWLNETAHFEILLDLQESESLIIDSTWVGCGGEVWIIKPSFIIGLW